MKTIVLVSILFLSYEVVFAQRTIQSEWKFYTPGTTGILGDYAEALWIDQNGDPYIGAYTPGWEEGGFSRFDPFEHLWYNYSNVEYPVIGSIYDVGSSRISDIEEDQDGVLWMATWRGILKFDPAIGGSSLAFWGAGNSPHPGGRTKDLDVAPDGTIWAAVLSVVWGMGGLVQFNPATNQWRYWGYGSTANNWPSLTGQCEHISIQSKFGGGYVVWVDGEGWNTMILYDSDTQLFTLQPQTNSPGEVVALPGNDCTDEAGNLWVLRYTTPGNNFSLDYRKPDGTWVSPAQPVPVVSDIWAFKAKGNQNALITGINSEVFYFNGSGWQSKGIWRDGAYTYGLDVDLSGNIWATGTEGAARRDAITGTWQRYRITNTGQIDYFVDDMAIDAMGNIWTTANGGPGVGGFQKFDGIRWTGFNEYTYGLGYPFPFPTDNTEAICYRHSNGTMVVNPMFNNLHSWNGSNYSSLGYPAVRSRGLVEDSQQRLWSLGEYYDLSYLNESNSTWVSVPFVGWGASLHKDPTRPGTVWACSGHHLLRTDGVYQFSKEVGDFPELDPQSDVFSSAIPTTGGIAWLGSNKGLFRIDAGSDTYQFYSTANSMLPGEQITPLGVSPDGLLWFTNFGSVDTTRIGLCWFDGSQFGVFPVEDGGLPHAQISDMEIKTISGGYELWMSCLSRGIAVMTVTTSAVGLETTKNCQLPPVLKNFPNPFADGTIISFISPAEGVSRFTITDIHGRIIRDFGTLKLMAGQYHLEWDGNNSHGQKVGAGIFVGRLEQEGQITSILLISLE